MNLRPMLVAAALVAAGLPGSLHAQAAASTPLPGASAPATRPAQAKPTPNVPTPEDKRDTASRDLRPERPTTPQVSIPLGKSGQPKLQPQGSAAARKAGKTGGGIDDAVARCNAEVGEAARSACRERAAQNSGSR